VAARLDIDTSTLSKVERGERPITKEYLRPLADILRLKLKQIQVKFITDNVHRELGGLEYVLEGLKEAEKQIRKTKK
jgi:transcriptional regulator with XRE-family HTH domain